MTSDGVLLVGHGTVTDVRDIPAFLARIRKGRPVTDAMIAEVTLRHRAVGGSPFLEVSRAQARALQEMLGLPVMLGMTMWEPWIADALLDAGARDLRRLCVLPLAPFSVHVYRQAVEEARAALAPEARATELVCASAWGTQADLVAAHVAAIAPHLASTRRTALVLSAHSLPRLVIERGDPYRDQFEALVRAVCSRLRWEGRVAYQSQGMAGGEWIRPTVEETLVALESEGFERVVWAPIGFLTDHVETLYDLDIEAAERARTLGLELARVPALNVDEGLIRAMATAVREALAPTSRPIGVNE
jgi:ferrochelatase